MTELEEHLQAVHETVRRVHDIEDEEERMDLLQEVIDLTKQWTQDIRRIGSGRTGV